MKQNRAGGYYIIDTEMSRPLFEEYTKKEKTGLPRRTKVILIVSVVAFHAVVLYFAFTAKLPLRIFHYRAKAYTLSLVPPIPGLPSGGGPGGGTVAGGQAGGSQGKPGTQARPAAPPGPVASVEAGPQAGVVAAAPPRGPAALASNPFAIKIPAKPGPILPEELQRGVPGGVLGALPPLEKTPKLWTYTQTDAWGKTPVEGSGPGSPTSPGGPLGSAYETVGSGTGPKVLYRGNPSLVARGYDIRPWARLVVGLLQKNWELPASDAAKATGRVGITIVVERTGTLSTVRVVESPRDQVLVSAALDAVTRSLPLPKLPDDYPGLVLEAYLLFDYHEGH